MKREPGVRRDQREITIPSDARPLARRRGPVRRVGRGVWSAGLSMVVAGARLCRRRPGEVLGVLVAAAAAGAVSLNALGSQSGRHPAPILANLNARPATLPVPRKPTADRTAETAEPKADTKAKADPPRTAARDGIGEIIKASEPPRPGDTTASVTPKAEDSVAKDSVTKGSVTKAQRALVKLGYGPLRADGVLGAGTRAAISRFERDRKLPVTGEPGARTLRELAARSG